MDFNFIIHPVTIDNLQLLQNYASNMESTSQNTKRISMHTKCKYQVAIIIYYK